jgi:hypothetical protein
MARDPRLLFHAKKLLIRAIRPERGQEELDRHGPTGNIPRALRPDPERERSNGADRRIADLADRGLGRLNWADSGPKPLGENGRFPPPISDIPLTANRA